MGCSVVPGRAAWPFPILDLPAARVAVGQKATELIERSLRAFPGWFPPPFDPHVYAEVLGIEVITTDTPAGWDALFIPTAEQQQIVLNTAVRSHRRRSFSLAHEIAHSWFEDPDHLAFFMRSRERERYERDEAACRLERLCDAGAAELLMPGKWMDPIVEREGYRAHTVATIAEVFAVSHEAAALRILEKRGGSCAVGFFEFAPQPSLETKGSTTAAKKQGATSRSRPRKKRRLGYRARRVFRSEGFPLLFPHGKSVPEDSAIYRSSLGSSEVEAVETFTLGRSRHRLHVTAYPLHRDGVPTSPPVVCAFLAVV